MNESKSKQFDWKPGVSIQDLRQRAKIIQNIRQFFHSRQVLEVETPIISKYPAVDLHLDSIKVSPGSDTRYLITSPEYHMKRLLTAGSGSIFQLTKAFRCDEFGVKHNPEFTILEWYREGWTHWQLMAEIDSLLQEILDTKPADYLSYQDVFQQFLNIQPLAVNQETFSNICKSREVSPPADLLANAADRDELLNFLLGTFIEPFLGKDRPVFLHDYPASQANLAELYEDRPDYAKRFEIYYRGYELGNGFCELTDASVQRDRFHNENLARKNIGKNELPLDEGFLAALEVGMPDCSGVAMGVDRMVMLALKREKIDEVTSFSWPRA